MEAVCPHGRIERLIFLQRAFSCLQSGSGQFKKSLFRVIIFWLQMLSISTNDLAQCLKEISPMPLINPTRTFAGEPATADSCKPADSHDVTDIEQPCICGTLSHAT